MLLVCGPAVAQPDPRPVVSPSLVEYFLRKSNQPVELAPSSVTIITGEQLRATGARFLTDALRLVPGIEVNRTSSTDSNASFRGFNDASSAAQGILVQLDGRPVYNDFFGNQFWDTLPVSLEDVVKIEVIRGPGTFLHGPNAMHGVINIVTAQALDAEADSTSLTVSGGTARSGRAHLTHVKRSKDGKSALKLTASADDIGEFDHAGENGRDKWFVEAQYGRRLSETGDHRLEFTFGTSDQKLDLLIPRLSIIPQAEYRVSMHESFVTGRYVLDSLRVRASWNAFNATALADVSYPDFHVDLDTVDLDLQHTLEIVDDHTLTWGAGLRRSEFVTQDLDVAAGRHHTTVASLFVQDEMKVAGGTFLTAGFRADRHSIAGDHVSPRVALVRALSKTQVARLSWGTGIRMPSLREFWFNMPVTLAAPPVTLSVDGNRQLRPEKLESTELSYSGSYDNGLQLRLNTYYNRIDGLIEFDDSRAPSIVPVNLNDEEAYGAEVDAEYAVSDAGSVFLTYAWVTRRNRHSGLHNPLTPRHKANAGYRYRSGGVDAALWASFFDSTTLFDQRAGSYTLLNGSISVALSEEHDARAFLRVFNMLDNDHREHPYGDEYGLLLSLGVQVRW